MGNHCIEVECKNCEDIYCVRCKVGVCPNCGHSYYSTVEEVFKDLPQCPSPDLSLHYDVSIITLNEYVRKERSKRILAAREKKRWTNNIKFHTLAQSKTKLNGLYDLKVTWYRKSKRHDPDNVYFGIKFLLDGIVAAGTLPDDNRKHIRDINNSIIPDDKDSVLIEFYKVK